MKNMRLYKIFDWCLVALSYVAAILLEKGAMEYLNNPETVAMMNPLRIAGIVLYVVLLTLQLPVYVMGIVYGITAKESMAKHNMIVKLFSIPFFVKNWVALYFLSFDVADINPILLFLMVPLSVIVTFSIMFRSSLPNVVYFIKNYVKKTLKVTPWAIISLILSFVFCLDVVAGIILFNHERNQRPDIAARIRAERLKKVEEWKSKKHKSLSAFKIKSIITTSVLSLASITIVVMIALKFRDLFSSVISFGSMFSNGLFIASIVVVAISSLLKLVFGIRYGKHGEEDPTQFLFIMKMVDMLPTIILLSIALFCLIIGTAAGGFAVLLIPLIAVVIMIFVIISFLGISVAAYATSIPFTFMALFCIWSTSLSVFTYYINQRAMKNRKFANLFVIACLVCLWFPVLDIPAMAILRSKAKNNTILGDKPVIVADQEETLCEIGCVNNPE